MSHTKPKGTPNSICAENTFVYVFSARAGSERNVCKFKNTEIKLNSVLEKKSNLLTLLEQELRNFPTLLSSGFEKLVKLREK